MKAWLYICSSICPAILDPRSTSHNHSTQLPTHTTQPPICLQEWDVRVSFAPQQYASLTLTPAGTNPIHNKKPKKKVVEEDEDDKAYKLKVAAGTIL